jgi:hypothetical protein
MQSTSQIPSLLNSLGTILILSSAHNGSLNQLLSFMVRFHVFTAAGMKISSGLLQRCVVWPAVSTSETSVSFSQTKPCHIPKESSFLHVRFQVLTAASMTDSFLGCSAMWSCGSRPTFQRCVLPSPSVRSQYALKRRSTSARPHGSASHKAVIFSSCFLISLIFIITYFSSLPY